MEFISNNQKKLISARRKTGGNQQSPCVLDLPKIIAARKLKLQKKVLAGKKRKEYSQIYYAGNNYSPFWKINHFLKWAIKLIVPDFLIGYPNLWNNLKILRRHSHFKPLRVAIAAYLIFILVLGSIGIYFFQSAPQAQAQTDFSFKVGYYLGTGVTQSITGLGFTPEVIMIKSDTTAGQLIWKSTAMAAEVTAHLGVATGDDYTGRITFDTNGFTVSNSLTVNAINVRYTYIAFAGSDCSSSGTMCVDSYWGDGLSPRKITTNFKPDLILVKNSGPVAGIFRTSAMDLDTGAYFSATANNTAGAFFTALDGDGFNVGATNNVAGNLFYYLAFKELPGKLKVGFYEGNGIDDRNLDVLDFRPNLVFIKSAAAIVPVFNTTYNWGDHSHLTTAAANAVNHVQGLRDKGFQVGSSTSVNQDTILFHYFAFSGMALPNPGDSFYMQRGSYTGIGAEQYIDTEFAPDLIFIKGNNVQLAVWSTSLNNNLTFYFSSVSAGFANGIISMDSAGFTIGTHATVNSNSVTYEFVVFGNATTPRRGEAAADFIIGAYTGNGVAGDGRNIDYLGISPDMVVVKNALRAQLAPWRSSVMATNTAAHFSATDDVTDGTIFQTLHSDGFTIGTNARANEVAYIHIWFAFKNSINFNVGSYVGNNEVDREITGLGFDLDFVWIKRDIATRGVHRSTSPTITDNFSQHFMNVSNATNMITGFIPDGFKVGNSVEVNLSDNYRWAAWNATAVAAPPDMPTNLLPEAGATGQNLSAILVGSDYSDPGANPQIDAQWEVDDNNDFSSPVWTRTAREAETTTTINDSNGIFGNELEGKTELDHNTTYYWRVRYSNNVWSAWSGATSFITNIIEAPVNISPPDGGSAKTLTPVLTASDFSDQQPGHTASSSRWQISTTNSFSFPLYDSEAISYSNTHAVPNAVLSDRSSYHWRVRYQDSSGHWSEYSLATKFLVAESVISIKPLFSALVDQGDIINIDAQVKLGDGTAVNNATVTISIYNPVGEKVVNEAAMLYRSGSQGLYRYNYTIPSVSGSYLYEVTALTDSGSGYGAANFEVRTIAKDVETTKETVEEIKSKIEEIKDIVEDTQMRVTDLQTNMATVISEIGTGNISAIKTKTDTINWADITGIITMAGEIKDKTDTISWADIAAIKTKTDTISWADVIGIDTKVTDIQTDIVALILEIGTGNISAIKTKTDTINWADIESIITTTGEIKGKTDFIDWTDVLAIKTKTDTINWLDVIGIDTKVTDIGTDVDILIGAMIVTRSAVNDPLPTATSFITGLTNSVDDFYKNAVLTFTSGSLSGQSRRISGYNGTTRVITLDPALSFAPADGDAFTIIKQNVRVEEQVESYELVQGAFRADMIARLAALQTSVDNIYSLLQTVDTNLSAVQTTVNSIRASQQKNYRLTLTDVSSVAVSTTYRVRLSVEDFESNPADPVSAPIIIIYDALGATAQPAAAMTKISDGVYRFDYAVPSDGATGLWETVVSVDVGGTADIIRNDLWQVVGSPAQVVINAMTDLTVPDISADVTITNEGTTGFEYQYEWCVVVSQSEQCGEDSNIYYASAAKFIEAGQDFNTILTAIVPNPGNYIFKVVVYFGTEKSGASRTFTAIEGGVVPPPSGQPGVWPTPVTHQDIYAELMKIRGQLDLNSHKLTKTLETLDMMNPKMRQLLDCCVLCTQNFSSIQTKITELQAVSNTIRRVVEDQTLRPIVETYMEFGSIRISFLITNPADNPQIVDFKSFLPQEVRPEHIISLDGLSLDYDIDADTYFVFGQLTLGGKESVTRKVTIKDIWFFPNEDIRSIRTQAESILEFLKKTQYHAQGIVLKNDIDDTLNTLLKRQEDGLASPQERIIVYRENLKRMERAEGNLLHLKELMTRAETERGIIGSLGGIQTFAVWGIILAIVFGFGLLAAVIFAMWRHQTILAAATMGVNKRELAAHLDGIKRQLSNGQNGRQAIYDIQQTPQVQTVLARVFSWRKILIWFVIALALTLTIFLIIKFFPALFSN